ncbi:HNH endonuclease domain-containing protein, partial [Methanorbis rubei]|uniref:HNH endonuclease domain-containing protein n=1 Tax=Methanorbis rubei TaxID=3028300 RepID=UPI0030B8DB6D
MTSDTFGSINSIIERDAADTPYKYSLLHSVIECCQEYPQFARSGSGDHEGRVVFPVGILVMKWLMYYYPFFLPGRFIILKKGESEERPKLAFREPFEKVAGYYAMHGGLSVFYDDLICGSVPTEMKGVVASLVNKIRSTIVDKPMRHLGYSQSKREYSVFRLVESSIPVRKADQIDLRLLIERCGSFSISSELYGVFRDLGGFILGDGCVSAKWVDFLERLNHDAGVSEGELMERFSMAVVSERNVDAARVFFRDFVLTGDLCCVWSGRQLSLCSLAVDHLLPFSLWHCNDLWNLVPSDAGVNLRKSDKIPVGSFLCERKEMIVGCWRLMYAEFPVRFSREISLGLLGGEFGEGWEEEAFASLCRIAEYLVGVRGYE